MYGMVNKAVEDMVCMQFGEPVWEDIKSCAGVDIDVFMSNEAYPD
ncbi:heme NO-binding domain-containing protein, partial [Colwellia sp. BRX8-7]|nr:heme NO-binding domain-containing protein [Colwellia sp. BRX8-7]